MLSRMLFQRGDNRMRNLEREAAARYVNSAMLRDTYNFFRDGGALRRKLLCGVAFVFCSGMFVRGAEARSLDDCQLAWSKAVRSYLTTNRRAAPDGSVPKDMDALDSAARKWLVAFRPACEIEAEGDRPGARVEAAKLGVKILSRLDPRGCKRFLEYYMQSSQPADICKAASSSEDDVLRAKIRRSIPKRR